MAAHYTENFTNFDLYDLYDYYGYNFSGTPDSTAGGDIPPPPPPPPNPCPDIDYKIINTTYFVMVGIIIPVGLLFNALAFVVFATSKSLRKTTTGHFLLALCIADMLFLTAELIRWVNTANVDHMNVRVTFMDRVNIVCKLVTFLRYGSKLASAWITVAIMVERFLVVRFPLKITTWSTPRIAKSVIIVIFAFSFGSSSFAFVCVGVFEYGYIKQCVVLPDYRELYDTLNWIFIRSASLFVPAIIVVVCCILIAIFLARAKRNRERKLSVNKAPMRQGSRTSSASLQKQLTAMLLAVAITFVLLRLPYTITYYVYAHHNDRMIRNGNCDGSFHLFFAYKITDAIACVNYVINFFLYCLCGSHFRHQLRRMFHGDPRAIGLNSQGSVNDGSNNKSPFENKILMTARGNRYVRGISRQDSKPFRR